MRSDPFTHEQGRVEFRSEHGQGFKETLGIHFTYRLTEAALTLIIFHFHGYCANLE